MPVLAVNFQAKLEETSVALLRQISHDILCDFVDGYALGDALGVGLRSLAGWWIVEGLETAKHLTKASVFPPFFYLLNILSEQSRR